jgi:flagellar protein FliT
MNTTSLDPLLNDLLKLTLSLEQIVLDDDSEPEQWIELLDHRQKVMDQLSGRFADGVTLTEAQKKIYLQPTYESDLKIIPIMDQKKQASEMQLAHVRKSKAANQQYGGNGYSYSPYGAFFDKKN